MGRDNPIPKSSGWNRRLAGCVTTARRRSSRSAPRRHTEGFVAALSSRWRPASSSVYPRSGCSPPCGDPLGTLLTLQAHPLSPGIRSRALAVSRSARRSRRMAGLARASPWAISGRLMWIRIRVCNYFRRGAASIGSHWSAVPSMPESGRRPDSSSSTLPRRRRSIWVVLTRSTSMPVARGS